MQRNSLDGSPLGGAGAFVDPEEEKPHPGEILFQIGTLEQLVIKGDIPERVVGPMTKLLWKAERYDIGTLKQFLRWYLLTGLGKDRKARKEYIEIVTKFKEAGENEGDGGA